MSLARILKHLIFDDVETRPVRAKTVDHEKPKPTGPRMYRVAVRVTEIPPDPKESTEPEIIISPRRVLTISKPRIVATTQRIRLEFIEVTAGSEKPSRDGEKLPNLLLDNPNILKEGWYSMAISFRQDVCVGQIYNGVVRVDPSKGIKNFTPSPRNTRVVPDVQDNIIEMRAGLTP